MAPPSRPYVGVLSLSSGYTLVEISMEERSVRVSERLTAESVACRLSAYPPADPLLYVPSMSEYESALGRDGVYSLPFLPSRKETSDAGPGCRLRTKIVPPTVAGVGDIERTKNTILSALLRLTDHVSAQHERPVSVDDFVLLSTSTKDPLNSTQTNPLSLETAKQLGLMDDQSIPSLISRLLPPSAPAATRRFLRRFLLTPPPPIVGDAMRELVAFLHDSRMAMPPLGVPPVGRLLALLRAGQASADVYGDILQALNIILVLDIFGSESAAVRSLMILLEHETGMAADPTSLRARCSAAVAAIEDVISPFHHAQPDRTSRSESDFISNFGRVIPGAFFERNEAIWRGRVRREASPASYEKVERAAETLAAAVAEDFWGLELGAADTLESDFPESKSPIVQDIFNNIFALRELPVHADAASKAKYIHPRDRFGKLLRNRYTTEAVQDALSDYIAASEAAKRDVSSVLLTLSQKLYDQGHIPAIVQASHANLILSSALYHAAKARSLGWNLVSISEPDSNEDSAGYLNGVWPYWIDRAEAVANSFQLNGMWLLTAPNMAGKSSLLRSTASVALLSICGLAAPVKEGSTMRRFDHIFVRGASSDVPCKYRLHLFPVTFLCIPLLIISRSSAENKSAFGAEMGKLLSYKLASCSLVLPYSILHNSHFLFCQLTSPVF